MRNIYRGVLVTLMLASVAFAKSDSDRKKQEERLQNAGQVMSEILGMPESIPQNLLQKAKCVVVLPSVKKAAFIVGGSYGRGAMVCRTGQDFMGPWGAPTMIALEGASVGFQLGAEATDFVFLIMNGKGANSLLHSKVKIGADVSAAAGPVGRAAEADTDVALRSELLAYSRARGLFAGISLEGSTLRPDGEANEALYGHKVNAEEVVTGTTTPTPEAARKLVTVLERASAVRTTKSS
ncbi:MAG TPA: lipid-binding SYLF domain-containing protein [Candidatus Dormibacteraeota bacterium]|nr:lipid-binding SYLF domain-containing protein [Candidatus Dormibacteraeota bacterium]